jgi:hypothetical protein
MRGSPLPGNEPTLEGRLAQLDRQLRAFEDALQAQQQSHGRVRALEGELASLADRGAAVVRELSGLGEQVRAAADARTREALAASAERIQEFEARGARLLEAYASAVRAAQQAVARAEARIDAFDERVGREFSQAGREIREAAALLRERPGREVLEHDLHHHSRVRRLIPAFLAALLLLGGYVAYSWAARTLRDASARAEAAERQAQETRRVANQQIASIERTAQQSGSEALALAARAERMITVMAAADAQRIDMTGYGSAPSASGRAIWSPAHGVVITGARLPVLPAAETYQAWIVTTRGSIPLGLFAPDATGRLSGAFDFPANLPGAVRGFMVTREPAGGSASPSRAVVLAT